MKRLSNILALISLVAFASCAKEVTLDQSVANPAQGSGLNPETYLVGFGASVEGLKASVDVATGEVAFENADEALVYIPATEQTGIYKYNSSSSLFEPKTEGDALVIGDNYAYVYYPAASFSGANEGNVTFTMPEAISAGSAENLGDKNPMGGLIIAGSRDAEGKSQVVFKNLCSILRVRLTGNKDDQTAGTTVASVALSNTTVPVAAAGAYTVSWDGHASTENVPTMATEATGTSMSIAPSALILDPDTATDFYFLLPPTGTMENMAVTATLSDAAEYSRVRTNLAVASGKILSMAYRAGKYYDGVGTEADPFQIKTADDFKQISKLYASEDAEHSFYRQVADINFGADADHKANLTSNMIGTSEAPFTGSYDGNGKSLNYYSIAATAERAGLFASIDGAAISNVSVNGFSVSGTKQLGGIVGYVAAASTISGCQALSGTVSSTSGEAGGIVGRTNNANSVITDCVNAANVTNTTSGNNIGGILGYANLKVTFTDCSNSGTILNEGGAQAGGIVGRCANGLAMSGCSNSGIVKVTSGADALGGLVGVLGNVAEGAVNSKAATISNCYNTGAVISPVDETDYIGGIVGRVFGGVISECWNKGHVGAWDTADGTSFSGKTLNLTAVGGIVGLLNSGVVKNCYGGAVSGALIRGGANIAGVVGYVSTVYDENAIIINCFNRSACQSTNSGTAPLGGIVGFANANKKSVDVVNCLEWGVNLTNLRNNSTTANIGGLVGRSNGTGGNVNIRNCMSAATHNNILQQTNNSAAKISTLDLSVYKTYGLLYGSAEGSTLLRDLYFRAGSNGANYMGSNTGSYAADASRNQKTGVSDDVAKNTESVTLNIHKATSEPYTYEFTGYLYEGLTRATCSPTYESNKINFAYNSVNHHMSDWVSVPDLTGYSLPKSLYDLGESFYK